MEKSINIRKQTLIGFFFFMALYRALSVFGLRGVNCQSNWLTPTLPCSWLTVGFELLLWAVVLFLFLMELRWGHGFLAFFKDCLKAWPVFLFVFLAAVSSFWSLVFEITLYKVFVLLATTFLAIYVGRLLGLRGLLNALAWFLGAVSVACLAFVIFLPKIGIMSDPFYQGAWEGIFWHRNYMGCFLALTIAVFLLKLLNWKRLSLKSKVANSLIILLALYLLVKSKSATAIISAAVLITFCLIVAAWLKWGHHLKLVHYIIIVSVLAVVVLLVLTNINFVFGLLGRNTSLTGRVPLWNYLIQNVISKRPILGYGYGAIWNLEGFRNQLSISQNWGVQVLIGDNGLIDIGLHLGLIGIVLIIGLILAGFVRGIKYLIREKTLVSVLPVALLVFVAVANISLSLMLESETFLWAIVVASQVAIGLKSA